MDREPEASLGPCHNMTQALSPKTSENATKYRQGKKK